MSRKSILTLAICSLIVIAFSVQASAQSKPVQLSLFTPVQIFNENIPIQGVRISLIYGRSVSVTGLDWGLVNRTTTGKFKGAQFGAVGVTDADFVGLQNNWVNVVEGNIVGVQWGVVNYANYTNGLQLGLVNYSGTMKGIQIGFVNIIGQGGQFPVFPIVNWSF